VLLQPGVVAQSKEKKPKVIAMTDGEIDEKTSMVRFLLYTCDVDVQAIIQTILFISVMDIAMNIGWKNILMRMNRYIQIL
jgi:hypothetical protein